MQMKFFEILFFLFLGKPSAAIKNHRRKAVFYTGIFNGPMKFVPLSCLMAGLSPQAVGFWFPGSARFGQC